MEQPQRPETQRPDEVKPIQVPAEYLIHQEGLIAVLGLVGLCFFSGGPLPALAPVGSWAVSLVIGVVAGLSMSSVMWFIRWVEPVSRLERWQSQIMKDWTVGDALAVALFSGLAEEILVRALLQPLVGLVLAAALFAALHPVPDRRLWVWPVMALVAGLVLGLLFKGYGYPAAAAAHVVMNGIGMLRVCSGGEADQADSAGSN